MEDKEILIKAIKKAESNKFSLTNNINGISETLTESIMEVEKLDFVEAFCLYMNEDKYTRLIFSHEFAKAFWGERILCNECGKFAEDCDLHIWEHYKVAWQFHIQQMVIKERPLEYLEKFL